MVTRFREMGSLLHSWGWRWGRETLTKPYGGEDSRAVKTLPVLVAAKVVWPLWRPIWQYPVKLKSAPYPAPQQFPPGRNSGSHTPEDIYNGIDCNLLIIVKKWRHNVYQGNENLMTWRIMNTIQTAIKTNELKLRVQTRRSPKCIMLYKKKQVAGENVQYAV